jgi:ABC-type bacteriocin/lantibiotic exporter with double-glycine peptidase domain
MSLGQVLGTTLLVGRVSGPISSVIGAYFNYFSVRPILAKLAEVIEASEDGIKEFTPTVTNEFKGDIQFHDVNYSYKTNSDVPTLKNLNFHISAGQKIAIIGRSGSGKSTLAALMNGLLRPRVGEVLVDNLSLSSIDTKRIRNQISVVEQEGRLFSGTVTANIALGEEKPDIERVQWSASLAEIEEDILSKPGGFGSTLMYGGVGLSEGQKQRLLVARAIYKNPSILVLDEATSHLDPISEERLMDKVMREFQNKTVIFCTQRVHLALRADRVFFLENGQLMEMGSHYELVKKKGRYYNFYVAHLSLG